MDHVLPESRGGAVLEATNAAVLCRGCNARKGGRVRGSRQPRPAPPAPDSSVGVAEAAALAGVSTTTVLRAIASGRLLVAARPATVHPAGWHSGYRIDPRTVGDVFPLVTATGGRAHQCSPECQSDLHASVLVMGGWVSRDGAERVLARRFRRPSLSVEACWPVEHWDDEIEVIAAKVARGSDTGPVMRWLVRWRE